MANISDDAWVKAVTGLSSNYKKYIGGVDPVKPFGDDGEELDSQWHRFEDDNFKDKESNDDFTSTRVRTYVKFFAHKELEFNILYNVVDINSMSEENKTEIVKFKKEDDGLCYYETYNPKVVKLLKSSKYFGVGFFIKETREEEVAIKNEDLDNTDIVNQETDLIVTKAKTPLSSSEFFDPSWNPDSSPSLVNQYRIFPKYETNITRKSPGLAVNGSAMDSYQISVFGLLRVFNAKDGKYWLLYMNSYWTKPTTAIKGELYDKSFQSVEQYLNLVLAETVQDYVRGCYDIFVQAGFVLSKFWAVESDYQKIDINQDSENQRLKDLNTPAYLSKNGGIYPSVMTMMKMASAIPVVSPPLYSPNTGQSFIDAFGNEIKLPSLLDQVLDLASEANTQVDEQLKKQREVNKLLSEQEPKAEEMKSEIKKGFFDMFLNGKRNKI